MNPTLQHPFIGACMALSALVTLSSASAQDVTLTPQEIQASWVGKTVVGTLPAGSLAGKSIDFNLNPDASATLGGALSDSGTWRLSEQGYCVTWKKIRAGQERCFTVVRKGAEQQVFNLDGSLSTTITQIR